MMPSIDHEAAALVATAVVGLLRWLKSSEQVDDAEFCEANALVQTALADSDFCRRIWLQTGRDLREQITPQELYALATESDLRRWGNGRN